MTRYRLYQGALLARAAMTTLVACRVGGPSADPEAYVSFPGDGSSAPGAIDASMGPSPAVDADLVPVDVDALDSGSPGDAALEADRAFCSEAGSAIAICDPIHNTGCNPLQQCDIDPTQTTPRGLCLFNGGQADGASCSMSLVSESCAPRATCVGGTCRQLCACDGDCAVGECCSDTSGPAGFLLCKACR